MSRYINAEKILPYISRLFGAMPLAVLKMAGTDGVDIVRCKECKHGTYCEEAEMYICNANDQDLYEAEHFCSYGERKEGE